jgi:hypothetical protein
MGSIECSKQSLYYGLLVCALEISSWAEGFGGAVTAPMVLWFVLMVFRLRAERGDSELERAVILNMLIWCVLLESRVMGWTGQYAGGAVTSANAVLQYVVLLGVGSLLKKAMPTEDRLFLHLQQGTPKIGPVASTTIIK